MALALAPAFAAASVSACSSHSIKRKAKKEGERDPNDIGISQTELFDIFTIHRVAMLRWLEANPRRANEAMEVAVRVVRWGVLLALLQLLQLLHLLLLLLLLPLLLLLLLPVPPLPPHRFRVAWCIVCSCCSLQSQRLWCKHN